jgi:hypothetical protein
LAGLVDVLKNSYPILITLLPPPAGIDSCISCINSGLPIFCLFWFFIIMLIYLSVTLKALKIKLGKYDFILNCQTLTSGSEERKFSYRESELLKYLWQQRNSLINRRDILNLLWGNDSFFNSRNLDVYITKLRGYLKDDPTLEIITMKGVGYRFVID